MSRSPGPRELACSCSLERANLAGVRACPNPTASPSGRTFSLANAVLTNADLSGARLEGSASLRCAGEQSGQGWTCGGLTCEAAGWLELSCSDVTSVRPR